MKNKLMCMFLAGFILFTGAAAVGAFDLTVDVKNGSSSSLLPINQAGVFLIVYDSMGEPHPTQSKIQLTNTIGRTVFTGLTDGVNYQLLTTKQGFYPTLKNQLNSTPVTVTSAGAAVAKTIHLMTDPYFMANHCRVSATVIADTSTFSGSTSLIFGGVQNDMVFNDDIAVGIGTILKSAGEGTLLIPNVPSNFTADYYINCFSPEMGVEDTAGPIIGVFGSESYETVPVVGTLDLTTSDFLPLPSPPYPGMRAIIYGIVKDTEGVVIENADVNAYHESSGVNGSWDYREYHITANRDGIYAIWEYETSMPSSGTFNVGADKSGYIGKSTETAITILELNSGKRIDFTGSELGLELANGTISGILLRDGVSVPDGWVHCWGDESAWNVDGDTATAVTDRANGWGNANVKYDGTFSLSGLAPGNYYLKVNSDFSEDEITFNFGADGSEDTYHDEISTNVWAYVHTSAIPATDDDLRITISTSGTCAVYSSTGGFLSNTVEVELEPAVIVDTAVITGSIVLISGTGIAGSSPITLIAREDWDSHNDTISSTDTAVFISSSTNGDRFIQLANRDVFDVSISSPPLNTTYNYIDGWQGRIVWESSNLQQPPFGASIFDVSYKYHPKPVGDFHVSSGTGMNFPYTLNVANDRKYQLEVNSMRYGVIWGPELEIMEHIDFTGASNSVVIPPIKVVAAGQLQGIVRKPDGTIFKPTEKEFNKDDGDPNNDYGVYVSMEIQADGDNVDSWNDGKIEENGTFLLGGLLPGKYTVKTRTELNIWCQDDTLRKQIYAQEYAKILWAEGRKKDVVVTVSTTPAKVILQLKEGVRVQPTNLVANSGISSSNLVAATSYFYQHQIENPGENDGHSNGGIGIMGVPKDTKLTAETIRDILFDEPDIGFGYMPPSLSTTTGERWESTGMLIPGEYDFYAGAKREYKPEDGIGDNSMVFVGELRGVTVDETLATTDVIMNIEGSTMAVKAQSLTMPQMEFGNCELNGTITGNNVITAADMVRLAANFNEFIGLIPVVMLFNNINNKFVGFSMEVPEANQTVLNSMFAAISSGNLVTMQTWIANNPLIYRMKFLKPGNYTAVYYSPNYPTVTKQITLTAGQTKTLNINFDTDADTGEEQIGASVSATFISTNSVAIPGVVVSMKGGGLEKNLVSDENGQVSAENLAKGIYYFQIDADGYAKKAAKLEITEYKSYSKTITMTVGTEIMFGYVYSSYFPSPEAYEGAIIAAFDTTTDDDMLGLYTAETDEDGKYEMTGLIKDHTYKVWVIVPGKLIYAVEHTAGGITSGYNFLLKNLDPTYNVQYNVQTSSAVFKISANKTMYGAPDVSYKLGDLVDRSGALWAAGGSVLGTVAVSTVTSQKKWTAEIPVASFSDDQDYTLKVYGQDTSLEEVTVYSRFNMSYPNTIIKDLSEIIAMGGAVDIDDSGTDPSSIDFPVGSVGEASGAGYIPSYATALNMAGEEAGEVRTAAAIGGFASLLFSKQSLVSEIDDIISDIYTIQMSTDVEINRNIVLNLAYNRDEIGDDYDEVNVRRYNESSGRWELVEGVVTIEPVGGVVSIEVSNITSASASPAAGRSASAASQGGDYAVFYGIPSEQTGPDTYAGAKFRMYNFPNPFDLEQKNITLQNRGALSAAQTVEGTAIKVYLPSKYGVNAKIEFKIFNIAGELVRTIDGGERDGGYIYFAEWDGRNDGGEKCASGIYLAIPFVNGSTVMDEAHKMAIVK